MGGISIWQLLIIALIVGVPLLCIYLLARRRANDDVEPTQFRDLSALSMVLKICLAVYISIAAIGLWSGWQELDLLQRAADGLSVSEAEAEASDARQGLLGGLYFLVFLATGIIFLRWTYLSNRNARTLDASDMKYTPGWAVGWYFIPVATLWKPYQALKETFKASHPGHAEDWQDAPRPGLMPLWWTLWIAGTFVGQAAFRISARAETLDELLISSWLTFVSDAIDIPLGIVVVLIVAKLQAWQSAKHQALGRLGSLDTRSASRPVKRRAGR